MQCDLSFIRYNAMLNVVLMVVSFKIHFLICSSFDHDKISMANANIDTLYAGSLRIKKSICLFRVILHFISGE